jgi:hypothetical protein
LQRKYQSIWIQNNLHIPIQLWTGKSNDSSFYKIPQTKKIFIFIFFQSNPTFKIEDDKGVGYVLRKKPPGKCKIIKL